MTSDVRLERFDAPRPLAVVRRRAGMKDLSTVIPQACGEIFSLAKAQRPGGVHRMVAIYLNDKIDLEIGVELDSPIADGGGLFSSALPAGPVAHAVHLGPYQDLKRTHEAIHEWCDANGYEPLRPCWEIYGHWLKEWDNDPSKIRTDVYYLLRDGGVG
jgi:hypothetical protein